jgi:tetratricopeptide (TPR) repeat protein
MGLPRNDVDVIEFEKIANQAVESDGQVSTFNANFYRNLMKANFLFITNEQKDANDLMEENVRLMETHPHMIALKPSTYLGILRNKAVNELSLMRYKPLFDTIKKMDAFVSKYGQLNRSFEVLSENLKLFVYIPTGQFTEALKIAERLDKIYALLPPTKALQKEKQLQHYAFAYIYIGLGEYKNANQHINELLNNNDFDIRSDLFCFAHILSLIIHFELENVELLDYRAKSTHNLLLKRNHLYEFEKQIIVFLKKTKNMTRKSPEISKAFVELKESIEQITSNNKLERNALSLFDLISWLESKIEKKSFMDIKQQKFNQLMSYEGSNAHMH